MISKRIEKQSVNPISTIAMLAIACLGALPASAAPGGRGTLPRETPAARETLERALLIHQGYEGKMRLMEISTRLKMPANEVAEFFKQESKAGLAKENVQAWVSLIRDISVDRKRGNVTKADFENADVLAESLNALIRLRRSNLVGDFHVNEIDLAQMQISWTLPQRSNFARVLRRASEIGRNQSIATQTEAFEVALKELGYYEAYRKGCRK